MKVVLINHSDTSGGASVVTYRLMNALCAEGVDARMLVVHKNTDSLRVAEAVKPLKARISFLAEHADIFMRNGFIRKTLFKISTGRFGLPLWKHPWVQEADIVVLNWVNQGMLSLKAVGHLARMKPVVWTMHDMWNMTGVCHVDAHLPYGCVNFQNECSDCPLVGSGKLAKRVYKEKENLYSSASLHFVAVSHRLAEMCRRSPLMAEADISVIPNALPVAQFEVAPSWSRRDIGLSARARDSRLIVMGAARLDDPVKNLPLALESLRLIRTPGVWPVFFGAIRNKTVLGDSWRSCDWLGEIKGHDRLQSLMAYADVVLSTSVWETLPGTLVEGISAGAVGVATDNGGQSDIITDGVNGYLVQDNTPEAIADAVDRALDMDFSAEARMRRHRMMAQRFGAPAVARAYMGLFKKILN